VSHVLFSVVGGADSSPLRSWSAISHWIIAILNISDFTRFITDMTSTTFGLCEWEDRKGLFGRES
jgi:cytosine/uracil/thiamine/allantoin permease